MTILESRKKITSRIWRLAITYGKLFFQVYSQSTVLLTIINVKNNI